MPPRKRKARAAPKPAKKRVNSTTRATSRTPLPEAMDSSAPSQLLDNNNAVIDYDQLAAAIIRQQQQAATFSSSVEANPAPAASGSTSGECQPFINTLQQFFSGEPVSDMGAPSTITNASHPAPLTVQNGIPLGASIPLRIKNKIWNDQFIDLKCLLPNFKEENVSIQIENNAIQFNSQSSKQSIMSLHQWTSAFLIFMAIYTEKLPQEHANLLKYCFTVREIGSSNGDGAWRYYDENFRKLRQSNKVPWQLPITEYMVKACTLTHSFRSSQNSSSRTKATQRVCFNYNNGTKCKYSPCYFKHICQQCSEQHPRIKCSRPDKGKTGSRPAGGNNNKI